MDGQKAFIADDIERCLDIYENSFDARQPFTMEYRLRRNDGEYRWVLDSGTPRFSDDGAFLGYIGSCIDITERKQAELDHQRQNMELARVGRVALMGELAASLAHEVNNPIGAIVTNASAGQRLIATRQNRNRRVERFARRHRGGRSPGRGDYSEYSQYGPQRQGAPLLDRDQ